MNNNDDLPNHFDPDFYGPKPNAMKAGALGCLLFIVTFACAVAFGVGRYLYARLMGH